MKCKKKRERDFECKRWGFSSVWIEWLHCTWVFAPLNLHLDSSITVYLKQLCVAHSRDILCDLLSLHICRWKERLIDRGFGVSCNKWKFHLPLPLLFVSTAGLSQDKTISFPQAFLQLHVHHQTQDYTTSALFTHFPQAGDWLCMMMHNYLLLNFLCMLIYRTPPILKFSFETQ